MIVDVREGARRLDRGDLVAYPTETVYGLGADASSGPALERLWRAKGRDPERGVSVLVAGPEALERWSRPPPAARRLAERFWPGPLTLVVPSRNDRLSGVATGLGVGFRCSPQPTAAALVREARQPVVSTSCNKSGAPACTRADEVERLFGEGLAIVGGEPAGGATPSTVVAVHADGGLELLREGAIPFAEVRAELRA